MDKLLTISDLAAMLDLINPQNKKPQNHILRFWEKEFKQIKPKIINNRRYYDKNQVEIIRLIKFLLKDKAMTIKGVKKLLNSNIKKLDDYDSISLKTDYFKNNLKLKSKKILDKVNRIKRYGKKNSY
tara:strand:+ start:117 stop:497 length:381 start_codon:yes stop_codon:yes gene_type:complete